jgi:pimeloyl-ACP methyl ester carboxylesterase
VAADGSILSSDGVSLAYRDYEGDGPGLVLLHGIGGNLESMDGLARLLSTDRRVVSLDIRFCGQSGDADRFRFQDAVRDVEEVTAALGLRGPALVGASLGGAVAGHYAMRHPEQPVVSIDGFAVGTLEHATAEDADESDAWMAAAKAGLEALTAQPETGNRHWMEDQLERRLHFLNQLNDGSAHPALETRHHFIETPDGRYRRHPARRLLADQFAHPCPSPVHMFVECTGPVLIIFCTQTGWPTSLERAVTELTQIKPNVVVKRLATGHTGPMWLESVRTAEWIQDFLATCPADR